MTEYRLHQILVESINKLLTESEMEFDNLYYLRSGDDMTKYVIDYIRWSKYGEKDPSFSILASKLHDALMYTIGLYHSDENDRKAFAKILSYCRSLMATVGIKKIECGRGWDWTVMTNKNENTVSIDSDDFKEDSLDHVLNYAIAYETREGVKSLKSDYRPGSINGSCGYVTTSAVMTDETKQTIYGMGLIPALYVCGSYHENWVYSVGILPQYLTKIKNDEELRDTIFLDCKF